jgi:hypothetical protein
MWLTETGERRQKFRFPIQRELRYKIVRDGQVLDSGTGQTINIGSGGVAFRLDRALAPGRYIQLSVSWPVLLEGSCPMRLVAYGRILRSAGGRCACTIDKYEFHTQARLVRTPGPCTDSPLRRWAHTMRKEALRVRLATA